VDCPTEWLREIRGSLVDCPKARDVSMAPKPDQSRNTIRSRAIEVVGMATILAGCRIGFRALLVTTVTGWRSGPAIGGACSMARPALAAPDPEATYLALAC